MAYGLRDMDRKLKEHNIHFAIFCSPHNPTGRVWEREEIEKAMEIYKANECVVISDEIWSDLTLPGFSYPNAVRFEGCTRAHHRTLCTVQDL